MISMSNSILPSASSALEPHGNGPEVLILRILLRMSRVLCPRAPSSRARLSLGAPKQDSGEGFGGVTLPQDQLMECEKEKLQTHIAPCQAWLRVSPLATLTPKKGLHEHEASSQGLMPVLHGAAPISIPRAILGHGEGAHPLGFSFFLGMERKLTGFRAQGQDSCGDELGSRGPLPAQGGRGKASWDLVGPRVPTEERKLKLINNEVESVKH